MPYINLISTANPEISIPQKKIAGFMNTAMQLNDEEKRKLQAIFRLSGIENRHTVISDYQYEDSKKWKFYPNNVEEKFPNTATRMQLFENHALGLARQSLQKIFDHHKAESFTHLITVSCTGMFAPGLDIQLIKETNLSPSIERTAIQFMGCFAAFNAMKAANHICKSEENAKVLIICLELCTIHFQTTFNEDNLLANTLFGDGCASTVISNTPTENALKLEAFESIVDENSEDEMAWHIGNFGFEMKLRPQVPDIIEENVQRLTEKLLKKIDSTLEINAIENFAIHPGGKRILQAVEKGLALDSGKNENAYEVLKNYGNMSSPTVLFVLKKFIDKGHKGNILSFAFGPGLTMESMLLSS